MLLYRSILFFQILFFSCFSQTGFTPFKDIFSKTSPVFQNILKQSDQLKIQIIYTQIDRDKNNTPTFTSYRYHVDDKNYFYPASLVKLPCAALALEKINELSIEGLTKETIMHTDSAASCQKKVVIDSTSKDGNPSIANYIKRMLVVSDNDAYSRIYEFLGQGYIQNKMQQKGYLNTRIVHRFDVECNRMNNSMTNPIAFYNKEGKQVHWQAPQKNRFAYSSPLGEVKEGKAYINEKGKLINEPKDFTYSNHLTLEEINTILQSILFPKSVDSKKQFNLTKEDYQFLYRYLSIYPKESDFPKYSAKKYYDSYKKYFMYGDSRKSIDNDSIRIFNVVGQSYGYLSDCAYICDFEKGVEFMLSAVIYVNKDGILNDGKYEYETTGLPFLAELGKLVYNYELKRDRIVKPDLSMFRIK